MKNLVYLTVLWLGLTMGCHTSGKQQKDAADVKLQSSSQFEKFLIKKDKLNLRFQYTNMERNLSYKNYMSIGNE